MPLLPAVRRDGELTTQSLRDALVTEAAEGREPRWLAVASDLASRAAAVVHADAGPLDLLRATWARIVVDPALPPGAWELRREPLGFHEEGVR